MTIFGIIILILLLAAAGWASYEYLYLPWKTKSSSGCTNSKCPNYDADATIDDGSCNCVKGCTNNLCSNYDANADEDDGSCSKCQFFVDGKYNISIGGKSCGSSDPTNQLITCKGDIADVFTVTGNSDNIYQITNDNGKCKTSNSTAQLECNDIVSDKSKYTYDYTLKHVGDQGEFTISRNHGFHQHCGPDSDFGDTLFCNKWTTTASNFSFDPVQ